jgi:2-dehydro-3-deoxyphosphogluconate aldolase / (4S)-4-hydroxy-2-oxoglutarate aldolase
MTEEIIAAFERTKVIPVFYHDDAKTCVEVLRACYDAGIRVFEFTNRGPNARRIFTALKEVQTFFDEEMYIGIGTIKTATDVELFASKSAPDFIVSPIVTKEIADACQEAGQFWIPGCMTPTEIAFAEQLGAPLVKLFPGSALGPGYVKAIQPLFPNLKFMPTGGVEPTWDSIHSWLKAGVSCVGMGSNLLSKKLIDAGDWSGLREQIEKVVDIVKDTMES